MSSTNLSELSIAILNAQVNGASIANLSDILDAIRNRTDEVNLCGRICSGSCNTCVEANTNLQTFYAPEVASEPVEAELLAPGGDPEWDEEVLAARARDEAEEAARTGMWADIGDFDAHDNLPLEEDNNQGGGRCPCGCEELGPWDDYDDRQDDYYDDRNYGLDWNESGYFD